MNTQFNQSGIAGSQTATALGQQTFLYSNVPPVGNPKTVAVTAALPKLSLIKADGTLAAVGETAVGVTNVEITQKRVDEAVARGETISVEYWTWGNFLINGLNLDPSLDDLAKVRATVAASTTLAMNENPFADA